MMENMDSIFTEEEWKILYEMAKDACNQMLNLPLRMELDEERMGEHNE